MASSADVNFQDMEILNANVFGVLKLCPKYIGKILKIECSDKDSSETYTDYIERRRGTEISRMELRRMCGFSFRRFQTATSPDDMDMTELFSLFSILFKETSHSRNQEDLMMKKLREIKDLRNCVMHEYASMKDPTIIEKIKSALLEFIHEAKTCYHSFLNEINLLEQQLQDEMRSNFVPGDQKLVYDKYRLRTEGKQNAERGFRKYVNEKLPMNLGDAERSAVFHPPELSLPKDESNSFQYQAVFECSQKIAVVSGVKGAGKTTILKNIILQFIKLSENDLIYLERFALLVFIQCNDWTKEKLYQVFCEHFGDECVKQGEERVLNAISGLPVLFLVDGFDERNKVSMGVLRELFQKTWHPDSFILVTTRPQAIEELQTLLAVKDINFQEYKIAPLSKTSSQLAFLKRYEESPSRNPECAGMILERFIQLDADLRRMFTEPLTLLSFCSIYEKNPAKIDQWRSYNDVTRDTSELHKANVKTKLADKDIPNKEHLIDNLFIVIGQLALEFLVEDKITFNEEEISKFDQLAYDEIKTHGATMELDMRVFLDALLIPNSSFSEGAAATYSFPHKSLQEKFAADYVTNQLLYKDKDLPGILPMDVATKSRLREVLEYVMQDLSSRPKMFQKHWPDLEQAITDAGVVSAAEWQNLLFHAPKVQELAKHAAEITIRETEVWNVTSVRDVLVVSLMLPHQQPHLINVKLSPAELKEAGPSWSNLTRLYKGQLKLDLGATRLEPCDDLLEFLKGSKCELKFLNSAISRKAAVTAVASVTTDQSELYIFLPRPLNLEALNSRHEQLMVHIWPLDATWSAELQQNHGEGNDDCADDIEDMRLPSQPPPWLKVYGRETGSWETTAEAICIISPRSKRFYDIWLINCRFDDGEMTQLLSRLHSNGIRSATGGQTRFTRNRYENSSTCTLLRISDNPLVSSRP